jgi:hypothetical protein
MIDPEHADDETPEIIETESYLRGPDASLASFGVGRLLLALVSCSFATVAGSSCGG